MTPTPRIRDDLRAKGWKADAACLDQDPSIYDTDDDPNPHPEVRCFLCVVRPSCLTYALNGRETGTWGGLSRKQRDGIQGRIGKKRKLRACPVCRSAELVHNDDPGTGFCPACGFTWHYVTTTYGTQAVTAMKQRSQPAEVTHAEV